MLRIGSLELASPVVLAPMAGVTNAAFRVLCREQELARVGAVSGLYVCEMVTARALAEHHPATLDLMRFAPSESPPLRAALHCGPRVDIPGGADDRGQ
mgnify:CR=1 FL=1